MKFHRIQTVSLTAGEFRQQAAAGSTFNTVLVQVSGSCFYSVRPGRHSVRHHNVPDPIPNCYRHQQPWNGIARWITACLRHFSSKFSRRYTTSRILITTATRRHGRSKWLSSVQKRPWELLGGFLVLGRLGLLGGLLGRGRHLRRRVGALVAVSRCMKESA